MNTSSDKARPAETDNASGRILQILNDAMLALQISVGHRTGLFDTMATLTPSTSHEIADASGLEERYVREWLGAMVAGNLVEHDAKRASFSLPSERAACLTRTAGPENLASLAQFVALLGKVENEIVECFQHGGGVPYSSFPEFQALMAEDSAQIHDAFLVETIIPMVPRLPDALRQGIDVLDIGCGRGHAVNLMARAFPKSCFLGIDLSEEAVDAARIESRTMRLANAQFRVMDAAALDAPERYHLITAFDAIHDQADPAEVLRRVYRSLCSDGTFLCIDIGASSNIADNREHPLAPFLYTVSTMHCVAVSLSQGGAGLGAMWGTQRAVQMLTTAGFSEIRVQRLEDDIANCYYIARKR